MKLGDLAAVVVYWVVVISFCAWAIRTLSSDPNFLPLLEISTVIGTIGIIFLSFSSR